MRLLSPFRFLWRRKGVALAVTTLTLTAGYATTYAIVESQESPTDRSISLADGRELAYFVENPEVVGLQRLILLHGAPADASSWRAFLDENPQLASEFEIIVVDRLGYGNSNDSPETSLESHAQSLERLITPGTVLVGHSYGGPVALRAAAEYDELLAGVVIAAGACDPGMDDSQWLRRSINAVGPVVPDSWLTSNQELLGLTDENRDLTSLLGGVTCRVAIVHGTWDPVCPHDGTVSYLESTLTNAQIRTTSLPRYGHNVHRSATLELADAARWCAGTR